MPHFIFCPLSRMLSTSHLATAAVPTLVLLAMFGCGTPDTVGRQPLGTPVDASPSANATTPQLPQAAITALDAGNEAYRAKRFDAALTAYRQAAIAAPAHAAPWFGIYMVANEMKNLALADSAMARVKSLSADPAALDAHAEVSAAAGKGADALPSGHPNTTPQMPAGHPTTQPLPPGHPAPSAPAAPRKPTSPAKRGAVL